jgi:uncharacterized protein YdaU (DUF1376 family)
MNFYKRFIGDIQAKTGHLSLAEFGAYDRLLDHCYSTEQPLPADVDSVCRIARAMTREERKAVESVLRQFFKLTDDGYVQPRVLEMLAEAQPKIEANRENGKKGGRPRSKPKETEQKPTGFPVGTQSEPNENLSQSQSQITLSSLRSERVERATRLPPDWTLPEEAKTAPMDVTPPTGVPDFSDSGLGTSTPAAQATPPKPSKKRQAKTPLPQDFGVSDRVRKWAEERGYDRLDEHLEAFRRKAAAKGYTYASWDDAFMEAIREDWAKLRDRQPAMRAAPIETYGEREEARKRRLYEEMAGRRPAATVIDVGAVDAIDAVLAVPGIGRNWT